jgi:mercuric ion transport protein
MADNVVNALNQRREARPIGVARVRAKTPARQAFVVAGGVLGALAASSCCVAPLVLFSLGVTGAWIGTLGALAPYQPIFVAVTLAFLAAGYAMVYRRPKEACAEGVACGRSVPNRAVKLALWVCVL